MEDIPESSSSKDQKKKDAPPYKVYTQLLELYPDKFGNNDHLHHQLNQHFDRFFVLSSYGDLYVYRPVSVWLHHHLLDLAMNAPDHLAFSVRYLHGPSSPERIFISPCELVDFFSALMPPPSSGDAQPPSVDAVQPREFVSEEVLKAFFEQFEVEQKAQVEKMSKKYGFDFEKDKPIKSTFDFVRNRAISTQRDNILWQELPSSGTEELRLGKRKKPETEESTHEDAPYIHEIIFATTDKPELLTRLPGFIIDIGLKVLEAHFFFTTDKYGLVVFLVEALKDVKVTGEHLGRALADTKDFVFEYKSPEP